MSVPPGWILKALAGNARSVAWAKQTCSYKVESVTTGLYPIEPIERIGAIGSVSSGRMQETVSERYQTSVALTSGTITVVRRYVYASREEDRYQSSVLLKRGDIYQLREFVYGSQSRDDYQSEVQLTSGTISSGVLTGMPHDHIEAVATVTGGTLE